MKIYIKTIAIFLLILLAASCIKEVDLYKGGSLREPAYLYPFDQENKNVTAEITIKTNSTINLELLDVYFAPLKYNKHLLIMLTQDDCKPSIYPRTWASINGKPLSGQYYYHYEQLKQDDLPPDIYYLGKTLGCTDGTGKEVRFSFTATLAADDNYMAEESIINLGYSKDNYRFYGRNGILWEDVIDIVNYGNSIAFHNVNTKEIHNIDSIQKHYLIGQDSIQKRLSGRKCKTLSEPDGNIDYTTAAINLDDIKTITAERGEKVYPFHNLTNLENHTLNRVFHDSPDDFKQVIEQERSIPTVDRCAINIGVHSTDAFWTDFLLWLNDTYGKDGEDCIWMPSQEEYYEYNYYRMHGKIEKSADGSTLKLIINLPSQEYFYYPSVTINLKGLKKEDIKSIESNSAVTGLSYGNYQDGVMLNIDCRRFLVEHGTHFVEQYEKDKTNQSNKADALYFVNMLKESSKKAELLNRIK